MYWSHISIPILNSNELQLTRLYRSLGFDRTAANALAAVGASLSLGVVFFFAYMSDRTNQRGATVIAAQVCYLIVLIVTLKVQPNAGKWSRWGLWTAVNSLAVGYHPIHNFWVQLNCRDPRERSISIAWVFLYSYFGLDWSLWESLLHVVCGSCLQLAV